MLSYNPYIAGNPVHGQGQFIGRSDILRDVEQTLRHPSTNAMVLFGQRRIGKTSVLLHIEQELREKQEFTPVYFDLQDKAALPLSQVLYQLAQVMVQTTGTPLPDRRKFDAAGQFFRDTFIPQAVDACHNSGIVLLLDEFDVLDMPQHERAGATFFPYLRDWMRTATGMQFVFVLGRRPEELSIDTLSAFKGILSRRVSLMKQEDAEAIIHQSESARNNSLRWSEDAVQRVWYWTQGHPYFTQLLCSEVWETAMEHEEFDGFGSDNIEETPKELPVAKAEHVNSAIDGAIEQGANALQWIWNGLPPAERIVMAAMAEAKGEQISQDELADILNRSKVRLILRELELAPETLISWDLLRNVNKTSYRFAIPLLRRWVATEKPLRRVKANLDSLEPLAESLYQSAEGFSKIGNVDEAERLLRNALDVNPYHFRARLLLGKVLLAKGNPAAAVEELKPAYEFDPRSSKSRLISALLALADTKTEHEQQLALYDKVLEIEPNQAAAVKKKAGIKRRQATELVGQGDLDNALKLYQEIDDQAGIEHIIALKHRQEAEQRRVTAQHYEESEDWNAAIALYQQLLSEFPDDEVWREKLEFAQLQQHLTDLYARALNALNQGNRDMAQELLAEIIGIEPTYKDAWRYLGIAAKGIDANELLKQKQEVAEQLNELQHKTIPKPSRWLLGFLITLWFAFIVIGGYVLFDLGKERGYYKGLLAAATPTPTATPIATPTMAPISEEWNGVDALTDMEFVKIEGGCFQMGCVSGSSDCYDDEKPVHGVCLDGFWMGKYEVTQDQWLKAMGENPAYFNQDKIREDWRIHPVEQVSWNDVQEFIKKLNERIGKQVYRLPSEAEWEYAARAGTKTLYVFGDNPNQLDEYAWYYTNSNSQTHQVGKLKPNAWGLHDMYGNVWEWVADTWHSNYDGAPTDGSAWTGGGADRIIRGGSWNYNPKYVRSAIRFSIAPEDRHISIGCRLLRTF